MYMNKNDIKKFIYFYRTINKINNIIDIFINTFKFNILNIFISTSINNNILIYCPFFNICVKFVILILIIINKK